MIKAGILNKVLTLSMCLFLWQAVGFLPSLFVSVAWSRGDVKKISLVKNTRGKKSVKIRSRLKPLELQDRLTRKKSGYTPLARMFNTTLFTTGSQDLKKSSTLMWLHDSNILKRRNQIVGSHSTLWEGWWSFYISGSHQGSEARNNTIVSGRPRVKFLAQITDFIYATVELQFLMEVGSKQEVFTSAADVSGLKEMVLLWTAKDWLTFKMGVINQEFLNSPLFLDDIPFISMMGDMHVQKWKSKNISLSFNVQQAIPHTVSSSDKLVLSWEYNTTPWLSTGSMFFDYDSESYYKSQAHATLFHFTRLPESVASFSKRYGNTTEGDQGQIFRYNFAGVYTRWGNSWQVFPNVGLDFNVHYIWNMLAETGHDQGILFNLQIPADVNENLRVTTVAEYFFNQSDSSVAAYSGARYAHNNRSGFNGEVLMDIYKRNLQVGFRYHRSKPVVEDRSLVSSEYYWLFFVRSNYAKIKI